MEMVILFTPKQDDYSSPYLRPNKMEMVVSLFLWFRETTLTQTRWRWWFPYSSGFVKQDGGLLVVYSLFTPKQDGYSLFTPK